jgi:hypothetical protein
MINLKETLLSLEGFTDNEYLDKYVRLIERNSRSSPSKVNINKHHIIPKSWFKLNNCEVNNDPSNLVTLTYREHVLAHYYLCLCTVNKLQYANELALMCLISRKRLNKQNRQLIESLPLYDNIYQDYLKKKSSNYKLY